jgi:hypothetical protein
VTEQEAMLRAGEQRADHRVPAGWETLAAERRWIELPEGPAGQPAPVRDLLAWVVRYGDEMRWVDLAVDDATGRVVRVERSR